MSISADLMKKAIALNTMSIPSPTGRIGDSVNAKTGEKAILNTVIYSNKNFPTAKDGKFTGKMPKAGKNTVVFAANHADAEALGIAHGKTPKSTKVDGVTMYWDNSTLDADERKEIKNNSGADLLVLRLEKFKERIDSFLSNMILGLPEDQRLFAANYLTEETAVVTSQLLKQKDENSKLDPFEALRAMS